MAGPAIELHDLRVVRGGRLVLPGVSLGVRTGSVTGLLGPSGSGKTTLIRAVAGVQIVESGTVRVLGEPAGSPGLRRRVSYVTQAPSVYAEFQAVQFMPAFILPQLLLCGLFVPRDEMGRGLELLSYVLPMTYAFDALDRVATDGSLGGGGARDVAITIGATLLALALGAMTMRRRTP